jgi:hypothetical protein
LKAIIQISKQVTKATIGVPPDNIWKRQGDYFKGWKEDTPYSAQRLAVVPSRRNVGLQSGAAVFELRDVP